MHAYLVGYRQINVLVTDKRVPFVFLADYKTNEKQLIDTSLLIPIFDPSLR